MWSVAFCLVLSYAVTSMMLTALRLSLTASTILKTPVWLPQITVVIGTILLTMQLVKLAIDKGVQMAHIKNTTETGKTRLRFIDKPAILLPIVIGVIAVGLFLFYQEGFRAIGLIVLLFTMLATGTPVFLTMGVVGSAGLLLLLGGGLTSQLSAAAFIYDSLRSFTLGAVPLFIFAGGLFAMSGLTDKLFDTAKAWLSFLPGNLAMATIASCALFAAISGSSVATAATIGMIAIPAMISRGYDKGLACGAVAAGGTLGILIPPSINFILYGAITGTSVGQLFMGGVVPGILITLMFMGYVYFRCRKDPRYKTTEVITWNTRFETLKGSWLVLLAPVIILGGIYTGLFTPTEAAAVGVFYGVILCIITGRLRWQNLVALLRDATNTSTMVLMIVGASYIFGGVVTLLMIPQAFTELTVTSALPNWGIIGSINLTLILMGTILEGLSIIVITLPILFPAVMALGYSAVWFGVMFCINMELALVTPPVGLNLYVVHGISGVKFETVARGIIPFAALLAVGLLLVALFEPLSTWLPSMMFSR
jgi:C4-dicarboxylate transporter DctM subunit